MDRPDYPEDEQPGTTNDVPALIHDYRAQREAWREQARNLARMREEVLTAADHEARGIVSAARADVRGILLKARRDLLVLAAQVRAAGRLGESEDAPDTVAFLPADDLGQVQEAVTTARHEVRRVLDESRPELEGLAAEGEALRSALRPQRPIPPAPGDVRRQIPGSESVTRVERALVLDAPDRLSNAPVDFEFSSIAGGDETDLTLRQERRPIRAFIVAAATIAGIAVMGTGWWLFRPQASARGTTAVEPTKTTESTAPAAATTRAANAAGERSIPEPRSPLSIQLAARRSAWVRVTADGRVAAERTFKQGETQHIGAAREVSIRAGDGGAVTVAVDGRQPVALGPEGEVVTRRFAVEAPRPQRPAAAAPSPSPTVPVARSAPQQPPATRATSLGTAGSAGTPPPRVTEQLPVSSPPPLSPAVPPPTASSPARSAATSADRPGPPLTPPSATQVSLQDSLTRETSRWLDAYYRQDRATMAAISAQVTVADDRNDKERMPRGLTGVQRSLDDVKVQVAGSVAMLTARMTERMENAAAGRMTETVSLVSHMWTQRNGEWQLYDVRLISASALSRAFRSP